MSGEVLERVHDLLNLGVGYEVALLRNEDDAYVCRISRGAGFWEGRSFVSVRAALSLALDRMEG